MGLKLASTAFGKDRTVAGRTSEISDCRQTVDRNAVEMALFVSFNVDVGYSLDRA